MGNSAYFYTCQTSFIPTSALTIQRERSVPVYSSSSESGKFKQNKLIVQITARCNRLLRVPITCHFLRLVVCFILFFFFFVPCLLMYSTITNCRNWFICSVWMRTPCNNGQNNWNEVSELKMWLRWLCLLKSIRKSEMFIRNFLLFLWRLTLPRKLYQSHVFPILGIILETPL